jgi:hypothetical protein
MKGRAAADDIMVIKQGQAKPARCRESDHAQGCCQRRVAWHSFWRCCRAEHRKRSIFETFLRAWLLEVGVLCRQWRGVSAVQ